VSISCEHGDKGETRQYSTSMQTFISPADFPQGLSLLPLLSPSGLDHLQSVGKEAQEARKEFILRDDQDAVWGHVREMEDGRMDIVLDNGALRTLKVKITKPRYHQLGLRCDRNLRGHSSGTQEKDLVIHRLGLRGFPGHVYAVCVQSGVSVR
jgi:hypothetical protein